MLCENCQIKYATSIFLSPKTQKLTYLCGECYRLLNNDVELDILATSETKSINLELTCKNCGTTFNEFSNSGFFGCEKCYEVFEGYLKQNVLSLFKEDQYLGKKPNLFYIQKQIKQLEQMVEICIKNGNIKKATKYGEEIQKLKEQNYGKL